MDTINLSVDILRFISLTLGIAAAVGMMIVAGVIIYIQGRKIIKEVSYLIKHQKLSIELEDFVWNCTMLSLVLILVSMACAALGAFVLRIYSC